MTTAMAAMVVIGTIGPAEAQRVRVFDERGYTLLGFIPGQTLRFSVGNLSTPEEGSEPVRAQVKLYDAQGYVLAQSEEVALRPGRFRTFDFNRDDPVPAGEPDTGRLQVRAGIQVALMDGSVRSFHPDDFPASMELVDTRTGSSFVASPFFLRNSNSPGAP